MRAPEGKAREQRLLDRANEGFGLLRHQDLVAEGLTRHQIARRLAQRRLNRVHGQVYAFGHTVLRDQGRWLAALWACGPGAVLSHLTAAMFHAMVDVVSGSDVHVSSARRLNGRPGIVAHQVRHLEGVDVFAHRGFTVTTIPRTFVDLADVLPWDAYRALADRQQHLPVDSIRAAQARTPFRTGAPLVTRLVEADDAHTKSEFERRFLHFAAAHRLSRPCALNARVAGHKADCVYRAERLVVELDGRTFHRRRGQMRADRLRDADYQLSGHRILRLVWDDLHPDEATRTAQRVRRMLAPGPG